MLYIIALLLFLILLKLCGIDFITFIDAWDNIVEKTRNSFKKFFSIRNIINNFKNFLIFLVNGALFGLLFWLFIFPPIICACSLGGLIYIILFETSKLNSSEIVYSGGIFLISFGITILTHYVLNKMKNRKKDKLI